MRSTTAERKSLNPLGREDARDQSSADSQLYRFQMIARTKPRVGRSRTKSVRSSEQRKEIAMGAVKDRYRGTTEYFHVLAELVRTAQYRGVTTYQDVAVIMGLPLSGSHMGKEVGHVLGEISEDEISAGRPMLSSVAVDVRGKVGDGFFALARDLGRMRGETELEFLNSQRTATYDAWRRPLPPTK